MAWTSIFDTLGTLTTIGSAAYDVVQSRNAARRTQAESEAVKLANAAQADLAENNAQLAIWQAQDALYRGQVAENRSRLNAAALHSTQRARMAANGLALDSGSAVRTLTTTDVLGEIDALTARENAEREAWAFRVQAQDQRNRAEIMRNAYVPVGDSVQSATVGSLLSGAARVSSLFRDPR